MVTAQFKEIRFKQESLDKIEKINEIIERYQAQGLKLTLRQLYYAGMPALWPNSERSYKNLGNLMVLARAVEDAETIYR